MADQHGLHRSTASTSTLDKLLKPVDSLINEFDRQAKVYTDLTVLCDDGTVLQLHKDIVCEQVEAIALALQPCFKEGQDNQYHLREKDSSAVKIFFDIVYGRPQLSIVDWVADSISETELNDTIPLLMAKVFCLADELRANKVFEYSSTWLRGSAFDATTRPVTFDAMAFVHDNAVHRSAVADDWLFTCSTSLYSGGATPEVLIDLIELMPDYRLKLAKNVLLFVDNRVTKLSRTAKFNRVLEAEGVLELLLTGYRRDEKKPTVTQLWKLEAFRNAVAEQDMVEEVGADMADEEAGIPTNSFVWNSHKCPPFRGSTMLAARVDIPMQGRGREPSKPSGAGKR